MFRLKFTSGIKLVCVTPWERQIPGPSITTFHVHYTASKTVLYSQQQQEIPLENEIADTVKFYIILSRQG